MIEAIQNIIGPVFTAVGAFLVAGGGFAAIAYAMFRFFSEKWLSAKFEERLALYKHAQQKELEHLRLEINTLMDRTVKLHQREFEVLPQAWSLFNDAFLQIDGIWGFKSYPDINPLSSTKLEEFLIEKSLTESQKAEIRSATDKTTVYLRIANWDELVSAFKAYGEWQIFFLKNGIFMTEVIKKEFHELDTLIRGALVEHKIRMEDKDFKRSEMKDFRRLKSDGKNMRDRLEAEVHRRLWNSVTMPSTALSAVDQT